MPDVSCAPLPLRDGRYRTELSAAVEAARSAGAILLEEFLRQGAMSGDLDHCPADTEAERQIRERLLTAFPTYGMQGEELREQDCPSRDDDGHFWLVDPNDGTRDFQRGFRGSAVSIALMRGMVPVLGVVFSYAARSGRGDLLAWAEGQPFSRNGIEVERHTASDFVLMSQSADRLPAANARMCAPYRFRTVPSIAYRLALVAAGEGVAAVSINAPGNWDVAAGHALLRGAGLELYREGGDLWVYEGHGKGLPGNCVGGEVKAAQELAARPWREILGSPGNKHQEEAGRFRIRPVRGDTVRDPELLDRALGALLGQAAGDSLGALVEGDYLCHWRLPENPPTDLADGGYFGLLAGQPTDDTEMALALARSILESPGYDQEAAACAYADWLDSHPFDLGYTTRTALQPALKARKNGGRVAAAACTAAAIDSGSQANGSLMRISPLAVWGYRLPDQELARQARLDAVLTHANPICGDAGAVYCLALAKALQGRKDREGIWRETLAWGRENGIEQTVLSALEAAGSAPPADFLDRGGWVLLALQNAFYRFLHAGSPEAGIVETVRSGGDTDTNAAIAGALLGAFFGAESFPVSWRDKVLSCRPCEVEPRPGSPFPTSSRPRPSLYWPVDLPILAERLLVLGSR